MKQDFSIKRFSIQAIIHLLFWVGVYFFYTYYLGYGSSNTVYVNKFSLFLMPITIAVSYFYLFYLIPNYLLKKKYGLFVLYSVYSFIISFFLIILSVLYALVLLTDFKSENTVAVTKSLLFIILGIYFVILVVIMLGLMMHNYKSMLKNEDLKNKFLQTQLQLKEQELKFLKLQIHPHFLFNSLNTIYGFALNKREEAPEMILKLSNLLDYILYQIEKPVVLLEEEINHLSDYVALEKMRFHDTLQVHINDQSEAKTIQIAPMLLIPFVENSFKHGAIIDGKLTINIDISSKENLLDFLITNSVNHKEKQQLGIGLSNIKKRLQMLYPTAHNLKIECVENIFSVELSIQVNGLKILKNGN